MRYVKDWVEPGTKAVRVKCAWNTTILAFGFNVHELKILQRIESVDVEIVVARNVIDLVAVPAFAVLVKDDLKRRKAMSKIHSWIFEEDEPDLFDDGNIVLPVKSYYFVKTDCVFWQVENHYLAPGSIEFDMAKEISLIPKEI